MITAHINRIGTAVPPHDVHAFFVDFARTLLGDDRRRHVFDRMSERCGIAHRFSIFCPACTEESETAALDADAFYRRGRFPTTASRMALYAPHALDLALQATAAAGIARHAPAAQAITHLIVASCTGLAAPGLDLQLAERLDLRPTLERTMIGFMGCSAAIPALRAAHHIVRSEPSARVLVINLELCTLHLQETADLETLLSFLLFGDGCAAAVVSAEETGIALRDFRAVVIPGSQELITWRIGDQGFDMRLSGQVPARIAQALRAELGRADDGGILRGIGTQAIDLWAVHAGGRTVLDAVEAGLSLGPEALTHSRGVLHDFGNMSSATVMFVLQRMLRTCRAGARGLAMAFGPGMVAETARFTIAG